MLTLSTAIVQLEYAVLNFLLADGVIEVGCRMLRLMAAAAAVSNKLHLGLLWRPLDLYLQTCKGVQVRSQLCTGCRDTGTGICFVKRNSFLNLAQVQILLCQSGSQAA